MTKLKPIGHPTNPLRTYATGRCNVNDGLSPGVDRTVTLAANGKQNSSYRISLVNGKKLYFLADESCDFRVVRALRAEGDGVFTGQYWSLSIRISVGWFMRRAKSQCVIFMRFPGNKRNAGIPFILRCRPPGWCPFKSLTGM